MLAEKRSDFFYTLEDDERRCLASIERIERTLREKEGMRRIQQPFQKPKK